MSNSDKGEFILLDTDLTTRLAILPVGGGHLYLEMNEPGSGEVTIPLDSVAAGLIESGQFVEVYYRGASRGGFFIENIKRTEANSQEGAGRWMSISGRGPLALLEDAIVWDDGTTTGARDFAGITKAAILKTLIDEAQARGALANLTYDFTGTVDSDSVAWTDSETYKINVGKSMLDVLRLFYKTGIDFEINLSAGSFVLSAYKGGLGTNKASTIYFRTGINCEEISTDERGDDIKNVLRTQYKDGFVTAQDATSITNRRRRETFLNAKFAQTSSSALTYAAASLDLIKDPKKAITFKAYDGVGPRLFIDYVMGDTVTSDILGSENAYRVLGIQIDFIGDEFSSLVLETNSLLYDNDLRMASDIEFLSDFLTTMNELDLSEVSFPTGLGTMSQSPYTVWVYDLVIVGDYIYFGGVGTFDLGNGFSTDNVVRYHIPTGVWSEVAGGLTEGIYALATDGTNVYAAGDGGGDGTGDIWKFNGTSWSSIGTWTSTVATVFANTLMWNGSSLYVGWQGMADGASGNTSTINSVAIIAGVAKLTSGTWTNIGGSGGGGGADPARKWNGLLIWGGDLYGVYTSPSLGGGGFVVWDGGINWPAVSSDPDFSDGGGTAKGGTAIADGGDVIYVAITGTTGSYIGQWTTPDDWTRLGSLTGGSKVINSISVYLSDVYIGGDFTTIDGVAGFNYLGKYSGGTWSKITDQGADGIVEGVLFQNNRLWICGAFSQFGGKPAVGVAGYFTDFQDILDYLEDKTQFDLGRAIHEATSSAITDNDEIPFWEDVAQKLRKITWANIKTTLKTYFDTLYATLSHTHTSEVSDAVYGSGWNGDTTHAPSKNAVYDKIETISSGGGTYTESSSAPGSPVVGDRWLDIDTGILYTYDNDGSSSQWVEMGPNTSTAVTVVLPRSAELFHDMSENLNSGLEGLRLNLAYKSTQIYGFTADHGSGAANNDAWEQGFILDAGTYSMIILCIKQNDSGKLDLTLDGTSISTANDLYSSSTTDNVEMQINSVVVATGGYHVLQGITNGKNGSSSGYRMRITRISFHPNGY